MSGPWDSMVESLEIERRSTFWWSARTRALFNDHPNVCAERLRELMREASEYEKRRRKGRK